MDDKRLFELLLELKTPWHVQDVAVDREAGRVDVTLGHTAGSTFTCPHCDKACPLHDHAPQRQWRHLDTMQHNT
ncbi:MAG: transposase family protein, partial [Algisphaera sp.]